MENEGLLITQYASSELYKDESGNACVIVRGLVLRPQQDVSNVIDHIYCDSATVTFKKDEK
jgi:hypothetical protein